MIDESGPTIEKCFGNAMLGRKEQRVFKSPGVDVLTHTFVDVLTHTFKVGEASKTTYVCEYVGDGNCHAIDAIGGREGATPAPCLFVRQGDRVVASTEEI